MNLFDLFENARRNTEEGYKVVPSINRERYTDLSHEGLEGPFSLKSGKVVYYDPQAGKYYDRDSDMYMSNDDVDAHNQELDEKLGSNLVTKRQAKSFITKFKQHKFKEESVNENNEDDLEKELEKYYELQLAAGERGDYEAEKRYYKKIYQIRDAMAAMSNMFDGSADEHTSKLNIREDDQEPLTFTTGANTNGTGYLGSINTTYSHIVSVFGEPDFGPNGHNGDKVTCVWDIQFNDGTVATIYDWNLEQTPMEEYSWHIGGKTRKALWNVTELLEDGINESLDDIDSHEYQIYYNGNHPNKGMQVNKTVYKNLKSARRAVDRLDNEYGAYAHSHKKIKKSQSENNSINELKTPKIQKVQPGATADESHNGWNLRYQLRRKEGEKDFKGMAVHSKSSKTKPISVVGSSPDDVLEKLKTAIDTSRGTNEIKSKRVTVDFNAQLARDVIGHGGDIYAEIINHDDQPVLLLSSENQGGMTLAQDRTALVNRRPDRVGQQAFGMSGAAARAAGLTHARYSLGRPIDYMPGVIAMPLEFRSEVYPGEVVKMGEPGVTIAHPRNDDVTEGSRYNADGSPKNVGLKAAQKFGKEQDKKTALHHFAKGAAKDDLSKFKKDKEPGVTEGSMSAAAHHSSGAKFGGYYKGTQKGAPRPGQGVGSMEESISLNTTVKAIANDIGEPITSLYATLKKMAKQYYANHGDLKGFGLAAAGVGSRWYQTYYVNKMQTDLYDLTRQSPTHAAELKNFLRGKMVKDSIVIPKSFGEINKELPEILARMGTKMGAESLARNAKSWVHNKHDYEDFVDKLLMGKDDDDEQHSDAASNVGDKIALLGKQRNHAEEIVNDVLRKLPSNISGEIRNAIARKPNKLLALQQELNNRNIKAPMEEGIAGNMTVRSDPLTKLKQPKDLKMKQADPFKGMPNRNALVSAQAKNNPVAKFAQSVAKGSGSHKNTSLNVKKGKLRDIKHKGKIDFTESTNFLTWAMSSGYNVTANPAVYETAKHEYNLLLAESKKKIKEDAGPIAPHETYYGDIDESGKYTHQAVIVDKDGNLVNQTSFQAKNDKQAKKLAKNRIKFLKPGFGKNLKLQSVNHIEEDEDRLHPGEYYLWRVYFDDGSNKLIKVKRNDFDPAAYYAKKNKVVINVDYNWEPHNG